MNIIEETGVVAVIRLNDPSIMGPLSKALVAGGVKCIEITMTTPNALEVIKDLSQQDSDMLIGAGTVINAQMAKDVIEAGAEFVVSPVMRPEIIKVARDNDKAMISGAFTPTEILKAWESGADLVKVFPATALGPKYFKDVRGPLPQVKLTPTGGVNVDNTAEFMKAGAVCIGVGSALLNKKMIAEKDWDGITKLAKAFVEQVRIGREK
jgi:2-dehydro-3-deoxyphosphogluconate aldolase/(4S)-4-hydroxy-2-oxoglutarate aldolase